MMLQLNPMIPMVRVSDGMKGYAMLVIDYSQEHDLYFVVAMDESGEIWTLNNMNVRLQKNITLGRKIDHERKEVATESFAAIQ